jgi:6-phosphogluconate dehydrogenase
VFQVLEDWNRGELDSFLIEITKDILKFKDSDGEWKCFGMIIQCFQIFYAWCVLAAVKIWLTVGGVCASVSQLLHMTGI